MSYFNSKRSAISLGINIKSDPLSSTAVNWIFFELFPTKKTGIIARLTVILLVSVSYRKLIAVYVSNCFSYAFCLYYFKT